jgi:hypothetical protein
MAAAVIEEGHVPYGRCTRAIYIARSRLYVLSIPETWGHAIVSDSGPLGACVQRKPPETNNACRDQHQRRWGRASRSRLEIALYGCREVTAGGLTRR